MQIQALINTSQTFNVVALGSAGERLNEAVAFSLSNPAVADLVFDQASMKLTINFKAVGVSDLLETATSVSGVSNIHAIVVNDVVVSVDLQPTE
jgi:hypothetical protein